MDSHIGYNAKGDAVSFVGADAVSLFRAATIASGLRLYAATGMKPSRAYTPSAMLAAAAGITGKRYKRCEYLKAAADVSLWCQEMKTALPAITI